jgi:hypothetical protein
MTRSVESIQSDLVWKYSRLADSQEHSKIIKLEADIERLEGELDVARRPTKMSMTRKDIEDCIRTNSSTENEHRELCRLALVGLAVQPRPIAEAPKEGP